MTTRQRAESVPDRVMRQATTRLVDGGSATKLDAAIVRTVRQELDRLAAGAGWYRRVQDAARRMASGTDGDRYRAESMIVGDVLRWRVRVAIHAPARLPEFDRRVRHALAHPAAE